MTGRPVRAERVAENLNRALHGLFARDERVFLLGEDVADPYGGAFRVTTGLSTAYPGRVLSTPLSENGMVGVASGLALCGDTVVVEIMFGDFAGLAFDQILNFATKSVTMYGTHVPMRVVVRCPVGGGRGYGATHSQSVQKHFIGIPNLALYELSPFHDAADVLTSAIAGERPCLLFEDKVLYTRRMFRDGEVDGRFRFELIGEGGNWARVHVPGASGPPVLLIAPGGVAHRALDAARSLLDQGRDVEVLVPSRLYPVAVEDLAELVAGAAGVWVVEESTAGGTWGAEVATRLYDTAWHLLPGPVRLINSADSVIPAAPHLENEVLVGADTIRTRLLADTAPRDVPTAPVPAGAVRVPKLNNNDATYELVEWLVADGSAVAAGDPVAVVETSKATEEVAAEQAGTLRHAVAAGTDCAPGTVIGHLTLDTDTPPDAPPEAPRRAEGHPLSPTQRRVAEVVTASHRDIPAAFTVLRLDVDTALATTRLLTERTGAAVDLAALLIKAVAGLHEAHPHVFATRTPDGLVHAADAPAVGVTVDVGTGLYTPVIRDASTSSVSDIADALAELRMKALRTRLREDDLTGMNLLVALNNSPGVVMAQPIIPPGVTCALSLADVHDEVVLTPAGTPRTRTVTDLGLAYDHRMVNGAGAAAFLSAVRDALNAPAEAAEEA
ncbi:2-oxo acid dehydrogenase subunit E2 [Actinophytocola sp. NPDC049390]|uniref:2-oxo acid dehydrogenase subunit E2 n=1 Tax=Actinophytocola sp. NPDC049390 TaxID=3363894 RepID=UPI0037BCB151